MSSKSSGPTSPPLDLLMHAAHLGQQNKSVQVIVPTKLTEGWKATSLSHQLQRDCLGHTSDPLCMLPEHFHNTPSGIVHSLYAHSPSGKWDLTQYIFRHLPDL